VGKWQSKVSKVRDFALLPSVDHKNPQALELDFEICSWQINTCKTYLTPEEFIELCAKVSGHCMAPSLSR
jgi:hypothetical protein